jgi:pyruvate dehydrogenase E1 component subunit alpha
MPRTPIEIPESIDYLSILDENGRLDTDLEPEIEEALLLKLYRFMVSGRRFDERQLNLQRQGRIGTFPPIKGQEAAHLGAVAALGEADWMVPAFRETAAEKWRGRTMESIILSNAGYGEGAEAAEAELPGMPISIAVGSQMLHAVGIGWAMRYRKKDSVVMTFFGDGATSEGDFHEALNFAGVFSAPVIFVCQNNQWAISIPRSRQTRSKTLAQKALAYGIAGIQVDGNDILAVYAAAREAVDRARAGQGPTLIECVTYRLAMHTTADDPKRYRTDEEVAQWEKKDPLPRFQAYLKQKGLLSDADMERIEKEVTDEIQQAVDRAEARMKTLGDPLTMFDHCYAELTSRQQDQKKALADALAAAGKEVAHG